MARRPFFSGDYGSALAQIDTRPIMQGAAAQAAMYQNLGQSLGQNIGGAIEKYGLMKEQQKKDKGFLKGAITGIKSLKEGDPNPQNDMMYDAIIAGAEDENIPLAQRVAQTKQGQQQINLTGQQNMQQSLISSRQATEEAQREKLKLIQQSEAARKALNMSLFKEQREYANTYNSLSQEEREGTTLTGRAKWVMNLPESLLESNALPMNRGIYDPEAARYRDLQMGLSEFKFKQAESGEKAFPTSERGRLEKKGKETDIRYKEGMMRANVMNALKSSNPTAWKQAQDLQADINKMFSGTISHALPKFDGMKFPEYLEHEERDDDGLSKRDEKLLSLHDAKRNEHSRILSGVQVSVADTDPKTGETKIVQVTLDQWMKLEEERMKYEEANRPTGVLDVQKKPLYNTWGPGDGSSYNWGADPRSNM
jgi:hypothetical protein